MAKTTTKAKKAAPTSSAKTPDKSAMKPHELVLSPTIQSAVGILSWSKFAGEADLALLVKDLRERTEMVVDGNTRPIETMLFAQAMTLETIFTSLARRAAGNDTLAPFQANMALALKAQAQCRATLEALAEIKNPRPVAFVKQANITNGPQQVNNGIQPAQHARSAQGGGGVESLPAPSLETTRYPMQGFFPPGAEIQTVGAAQAA